LHQTRGDPDSIHITASLG